MPQYHKGVPIPPCPKVKVMVTRHKGRIGAGLVGGALFGPLGMAAGAMRGGRDESTWEEREPTFSERLKWVMAWKEEFDRVNPNFVPLSVPKKPMGWFAKVVLWWLLISLVLGTALMVAAKIAAPS